MVKRKPLGSRKKGQAVADLTVFLVILFVIAILAYVTVKVFGGVNDGLQNSDGVDALAATASDDSYNGFAQGFDSAMVVALGIMYIGLFITSRNIGTEPLWFALNIFLLLTALTLALVLGNALDAGTNTTDFLTERAAMPGMVYVGNHFLEFAIGAAAVMLIGLFAKPDGN